MDDLATDMGGEYHAEADGRLLLVIEELAAMTEGRSVGVADFGCVERQRLMAIVARWFGKVLVLASDESLADGADGAPFACQSGHDATLQSLGERSLLSRLTGRHEAGGKPDMIILRLPAWDTGPWKRRWPSSSEAVLALLRALHAAIRDDGYAVLVSESPALEPPPLHALSNVTATETAVAGWLATDHFWWNAPAATEARSHQAWMLQKAPADGGSPRLAGLPRAGASPLTPSSPHVRLAVFTLVRGGVDVADYDKYRLRCVALRNVSAVLNIEYDDIAFHEGNVPLPPVLEPLERGLRVRFVDVRAYGAFSGLAPHLLRRSRRMLRKGGYGLGYRYMCRFFAMQWVHALRRYEFAMRLDEDVLVHRMVDVLAPLHASRRVVYGYALRTLERHRLTRDTLQPWVSSYMRDRRVTPAAADAVDVTQMYFTNFFITRVAWWQRPDVQGFLRAVDRSGFMHEYRWGDAPIQTAALLMFADEPSAYVAVDYSHISTENEVRANATGGGHGEETKYRRPKSLPRPKHTLLRLEKFFEGCLTPCLVANHFRLPGAPFLDEPNATRALKRALHALYSNASNATHNIIDLMSPGQLADLWQTDVQRAQTPLPPEGLNGARRQRALAMTIAAVSDDPTLAARAPTLTLDDLVHALLATPCCHCWMPSDELESHWGHVMSRGVPVDLATYFAINADKGGDNTQGTTAQQDAKKTWQNLALAHKKRQAAKAVQQSQSHAEPEVHGEVQSPRAQ